MNIANEIVWVSIDDIKPYEHNARMNAKTVDKLVTLIPKTGFNVPLVLDKNNVIVKGHARYEAAKRLGMEKLPCVYSAAEGDNVELDRLADNKIAEFSRWKTDELMHEIDSIDTDYDFADVGLKTADFSGFDFDIEMEEPMVSDEERRARFEQYLREHQDDLPTVTIATKTDVDNARRKQAEVGKKEVEYVAITCEKCGQTIFMKRGDTYEY